MPDPLDYLWSKDLCHRCLTSKDDDHDGDCAACAGLPESAVKQMRVLMLETLIAAVKGGQ